MTIQFDHYIDARRPDIAVYTLLLHKQFFKMNSWGYFREKVKQLLNKFLGRFEADNERTLVK